MPKKTNQKAFSLIELSIVIIIIGIMIAGVTKGSKLIKDAQISAARSLTNSSDIISINNTVLWLETTSLKSLIDENGNEGDRIEDESYIETWRDINVQSVVPKNATPEGIYKAQYIRDGINGLPVLKFNGSSTTLSLPDSTIPIGNSPYTIVVVFQALSQGVATYGGIIGAGSFGDDNTHNEISYNYTSNFVGNEFRNRYITSESNSVEEQKPYIVMSSYNATTASDAIKLYVNGSLVNSDTGVAMDVVTTPNLIGRSDQGAPRRYFKGYIAEIIVYNRSLRKKEISSIANYLSQKWGIGLE